MDENQAERDQWLLGREERIRERIASVTEMQADIVRLNAAP